MSDKVNLCVQSTASLQVTSALRICQERWHLLGNSQADGGGGAVTHMFKDRKFDFVLFDQTHNPRVKERLGNKSNIIQNQEPRGLTYL